MTLTLPNRDALKAQAKRLRADMTARGTEMTHAASLEAVAHQWGFTDWNTIAAKSDETPHKWFAGQTVRGSYLGHAFKGQIKSASLRPNDHWALTIRFDKPIDVVTSELFSSLRQQINCVVNADGKTVQKTSNGIPHVVLQS